MAGDYAYIADGLFGLAVIEISDPLEPGLPVFQSVTESANGVTIAGNYVYLALGRNGLAVIDVTDPLDPGEPVYIDTDGNVQAVVVSGSYAYTINSDSNGEGRGLHVIDISDPKDPRHPEGVPVHVETTGTPTGITAAGSYLFVSAGGGGVYMFDLSDPAGPRLTGNDKTFSPRDAAVAGSYAYLVSGTTTENLLAVTKLWEPAE